MLRPGVATRHRSELRPGLPAEESVPMRGVPPDWVQRVKFFIGCGTDTSSAKRLVIASAAVYMPLEPGVTFCYVMPASASETLPRTACACACNAPLKVCLLSARACGMSRRRRKRACSEVRVSAPVALAEDLPSWMLGCRPTGHQAIRQSWSASASSSSTRCPLSKSQPAMSITASW